MTYEEAKEKIEILENLKKYCLAVHMGINVAYAIEDAIKALEKQIPKKPKIDYSIIEFEKNDYMKVKNYFCPTCGTYIHMFGECCPNNDCRQAIDWSVEE